MYTDAVLEEIWQVKDAHAAEYGYDVRAMVRALQRKQHEEGRQVVSFASPRPARDEPAD